MSKIQAFSSVSVVDLTDVGTLNLYLTSNSPTTVVFDPNQGDSGAYSPNWATKNLKITPVVQYNGDRITLTDQNLVVTFKRKVGTGDPVILTEGENVSGGVLTVSANKLTLNSSQQLTYICNVVYTVDGIELSAEAVLTFTLISSAPEVKYCNVTGQTVFLYDTDRNPVGSQTITLTANTNCSGLQWQYKSSIDSDEFLPYPIGPNNSSINTATLTVKNNESDIWLGNDKYAVIKLATSEADIYDVVQINKIYDGARGNSNIAAVLTNENHVLSVDDKGNIKSLVGASTAIHIYKGGEDVTNDNWNISISMSNGLEGGWDGSTKVFTPTNLTVDSGYCDFTCQKQGYATITKRYTITKQYAGKDGNDALIYEVIPNVYSINRSIGGVYTPSTVRFDAYKTKGETTKTNYSGRLVIYTSQNGTDFGDPIHKVNNDESYFEFEPENNIAAIKCILYESGGFTKLLDTQTVVVTKDGKDGEDGEPGIDAITVGLGNTGDTFACTPTGGTLNKTPVYIDIPFYAYKGITRVPVEYVSVNGKPSGTTIDTSMIVNGTDTSDGLIKWQIWAVSPLGGSSINNGTMTFTFRAEGQLFERRYTWAKAKSGSNGTSPITLELYSEDGGTVEIGRSTTIKALLRQGMNNITESYNYTWDYFQGGDYIVIKDSDGNNITASSVTITEDMVVDAMWLRCTTKVNGSDIRQFYTVDDVTDELSAHTYATIAEFKNSQGCGAIYTRVYRKREEVDPIKSTFFSETPPANPSTGQYYYKLNSANRTCLLMKYDGSKWNDVTLTEKDLYKYSYYRINNVGNSIDSTPWKEGRAQYIDPTIIQGRMQFICEVSDSDSQTPEESESSGD